MARTSTTHPTEGQAREVERALAKEGYPVVVEAGPQRLSITGRAASERDRDAILDLARNAAGAEVDDNIEISQIAPDDRGGLDASELDQGAMRGAEPGTTEDDTIPGDFTDQATLTATGAQYASTSSNERRAQGKDSVSDGDDVYVPPTDPVGNNTQVTGGFQSSSMQSVEVARSSDGTIGAEAIRDAILREFREDAQTAGLDSIEVSVAGGVVTLTGAVADITDAESAQEVASRVPGVTEVLDQLETAAR